MKLKVLALVSGILVVLAVAAFAVNRWITTPSTAGKVGEPLMSGVDLAQAGRIEIVSPESTVTLRTTDGSQWTVQEQNDFPVDPKKFKSLMLKLSSEKLAHEVTQNKAHLAELGLLTKEENGGKLEKGKTGRRLSIFTKDGHPLYTVLLGNDRRGQGGMTFGGVYVRYPGDTAAYLVSQSVVTELKPEDWIDGAVLDLDANKDIASVRVEQPGQRPVVLSRAKAGDPWQAQGLPAAQLDDAAVRRLIGQLAGLSLFKVAAGDAAPGSLGRAKTGRVEFSLFDKRHYTMDIGEAKAPDDFRYLSIRAELDPSVTDTALRQGVEAFNKRFGGRLLGVYDWDAKHMLPSLDELKVKPKPTK